jgi:uncharacterized damage-inducible protein DinB
MSLLNRCRAVLLLLALSLITFAVPNGFAADEPAKPGDQATQPANEAPDPLPPGVRGEILTWVRDARGKLEELAAVTPEDKYSYRPGKGVRSTGEVFMHVAAANYGIPTFWGVKAPEGFNFETYEKSLTKKADIQKALKNSFEHMEESLEDLPEADMDKPVEMFGMKSTVRGAYLLLLSHVHEHLGQSIAYARTNQIVPPWTAREQAAAKAAADKKKSASK